MFDILSVLNDILITGGTDASEPKYTISIKIIMLSIGSISDTIKEIQVLKIIYIICNYYHD